MKKKLFAITMIIGAICFSACEKKVDPTPGPTPGGDTTQTDTTQSDTTQKADFTLVVNPHEVVLTVEEPDIRLSATITPEDPTKTVVWSSSDPTVASVTNRGYVEAQGYGECYIYAAVGNVKDSCYVRVLSYLESLVFNNAIIWSVDTTAAKDPTTGEYKVDTIEARDGSTWNVYLAKALLYVFSDGFYVNNSGYLDGTEQGAILEIEAPIYYGTPYLNPEQGGVQFSLGQWAVSSELEPQPHVSAPAEFDKDEYIKQMKLFIEEFNAGGSGYGQYLKAAGEAVTGPIINVCEYDADAGGYVNSYIPDALCSSALFSLGDASPVSNYMRQLDYSTVTFYAFATDTVFGLNSGLNLAWDFDTEKASLIDETVTFEDPITSLYGELPNSDAEAMKAKTPLHMPVISENPALKASLLEQIKDKKIRVIRMKH